MKTSYPEIEGTAKDLKFTNQYGKYLISHFNTWHGGVHIEGINKSIQAVLDGRIIAYRFMDNYLDLPKTKSATKEINEEETEEEINYKYSNCFVLIQHDIELTKEEIKEDQTKESKNEIVTFYSLYNHLMPISEIQSLQDEDESKKNNFPSFMGKEQLTVSVKENFEYKKKKREGLNARTLNSNSKIDWRDDSTKAVVIPFGKTVKKDLDAEGALIKKGNYAKVTFTDENGDFYNDIYINIGLTKTRKYPRVKDLGDSFEIIIKEDNEIWIDKSSVPEDKKNLEGARIRNIPETPKQNKDSTIVDIIEHGKPVTIKEKKDNGWYVIEGFEGYSAKSNFEVKVSFDDENITKGDIVKCDIPVKSGDHIGYTGLLTNEQNTGYAACQLDIFMEDGATDFISNKFGAGDTVKDLRFVTLPKDTELEQNIEIDVNLRKHLPVKVIETKDIYAKIKIESEIKRIIPVAGNIYTPNVGSADGKYKGYKEHPKGYDYINFDSVNTHFDNLLDKEQSRLIWVSTPTGGLTREVKFKPKEAGKTYWVKIADLDKTAEVVQTKRTITRLKTVQDYPTTADFILNRWTDNVITEEITIPVIKNTVVKKNELTKLSKDITKAFVIAPQKENNKSQKLGKEAIAELIPSTELKGTSVENEYLKVSCTYIYDSKEFTQKGWIKNNVEKFSAFNWDKFGFKIFDGGNEYIYDIKGLRDFEENGSEFIEKLLDNLDVIKDGILDKDELNFACGIPEIQEEMAKMICSHKMEWSYTPDEIAGEVTKIYDYLISKQPEDAQSELEQLKEDKLTVHKAQVENLMFWNKLKKKTFAPKETEEDKEYKQKKQKITKKYSPLLNDPKTVEGDSKIAMDAELDALDKKYKKEKYAPEPPKFPTKENVHHFHPIAFINQLKLMFEQGGTGDCPELIWGTKVSCEFRQKVVEISKRLECDPNHLMAIMALETGGKFDPFVKNKQGYVGLIQIGDLAAADINRRKGTKITTNHLRYMGPEFQLKYVEYHLDPKKGQLKTLADFYLAVLWPAAVGQGGNDNYVVFDDDATGRKKKGYRQNKSFLKEEGEITKGKDGKKIYGKEGGKTYVWEIREEIEKWYEKGKKFINKCNGSEDCNQTIYDLRWLINFQSQAKGSTNCGTISRYIIEGISGLSCEGTTGLGRAKYYQLAKENPTQNGLIYDEKISKEAIEYIDLALSNNVPLRVGVNHTFGKTINEGTTDHYAIIVGKKVIEGEIYYQYWDVGTFRGTQEKYRFKLVDGYKLINDDANAGGGKDGRKFIVTQIARATKKDRSTLIQLKKRQ